MRSLCALCIPIALALVSPRAMAEQAKSKGESGTPPTLQQVLGNGWGAEHVIVMVRDLNKSIEMYRDLGFDPSPSRDVSKVLDHSLVKLSNGAYLELTQFRRGADSYKQDSASAHDIFLKRYADYVSKREGGQSVGVNVSDAKATVALLRKHGFAIDDPVGDTSEWTTGHSPEPNWFSIDFLKPAVPGDTLSFIQYKNNDRLKALRTADGMSLAPLAFENHPNSAMIMNPIWIAVKSADQASKIYKKMGFGVGEKTKYPHLGAVGRRIETGRVDLLLLSPNQKKGVIPDFLKTRGEGIAGVSIEVASLREAYNFPALYIRSKDPSVKIPLYDVPQGGRGYLIPMEYTSGIYLELWQKTSAAALEKKQARKPQPKKKK